MSLKIPIAIAPASADLFPTRRKKKSNDNDNETNAATTTTAVVAASPPPPAASGTLGVIGNDRGQSYQLRTQTQAQARKQQQRQQAHSRRILLSLDGSVPSRTISYTVDSSYRTSFVFKRLTSSFSYSLPEARGLLT
jgi:hypothetical protein